MFTSEKKDPTTDDRLNDLARGVRQSPWVARHVMVGEMKGCVSACLNEIAASLKSTTYS